MPTGYHPRNHATADVERAAQAGLDIRPPCARVSFPQRADRKRRARVIDDRQDRSELAFHGGNGGSHGIGITHIRHAVRRRHAVAFKQRTRLPKRLGGTGQDGDRESGGTEAKRDGTPDAFAPTCDQRHPCWLTCPLALH